jgi:hypothetical protein
MCAVGSPGRALMVIALVLSATAAAAADTTAVLQGRTAMREARLAYDRKDYPGFLAATSKALELLPGNPEATYNLACAYALTGQASKAVGLLQQLVALGVDFRFEQDPDLASLRNIAAMKALAATQATLRQPAGRAEPAFTLAEAEFLPEGIAYDSVSKSFFVGSVHQRTVLRIDSSGKINTLLGKGKEEIDAPLGMVVDAQRRQLWVCTSAVPEMLGYTKQEGVVTTALVQVDLTSGKVLKRIKPFADGLMHSLNDVVVASDGTVYVSDTSGTVLYRVKPGTENLEMIIRPGPLASPQGLALSADEKHLFVADYGLGLFLVEVATSTITLIDAPATTTLAGIDGLIRHGNSLLAIRNGFRPHAVVQIDLDASGIKVDKLRMLVANHSTFDEPTLGVLVGNELYFIANSQWPLFSARAQGKSVGRPKPPQVLKLTLGKS